MSVLSQYKLVTKCIVTALQKSYDLDEYHKTI